MLRFYAVMIVVVATFLAVTMFISQQVSKLSNTPQFAYIGVCGNGADIYLSDFMHRITLPLTHDSNSEGNIVWSPNGALLAYGLYSASPGIHVITETGEIRRLTDGWDDDIVWIDNARILFSRENEEAFLTTYIVNIETLEIQIPQEQRSDNYFIDLFSDQNGEVGIFYWNVPRGGTDDLYTTNVETPFTIMERYSFDGSACSEFEPHLRP